jgi:hypothetical protein
MKIRRCCAGGRAAGREEGQSLSSNFEVKNAYSQLDDMTVTMCSVRIPAEISDNRPDVPRGFHGPCRKMLRY